MKKATLNYCIDTDNGVKSLLLESSSLYYIDNYTSQYRNDDELLENYSKKEKVESFIKDNGNLNGSFKILYTTDIYRKESVPVLYNMEDGISLDDSELDGRLSEIEKARRLLFNSKDQLFSRMAFSCRSLEGSFLYKISLTYQEYLLAKKRGMNPSEKNGQFYIDFKELIKYRSENKKLGVFRPLYEDMLESWKKNIMSFDDDEYYYYSRQLRVLMNYYESIKSKRVSVSNLSVTRNASRLENNCKINGSHRYKKIRRTVKSKQKKLEEAS